jgi:RNA polymerase sigma-70 factor (family 1)
MSYSHLNDLQLIKLLNEEDQEAFAEIYHRFSKIVYSLAFSYLRSQEAAQDIVQDVFVIIWTKKDNLIHVRELKAYIFVTARNLIIRGLHKNIFFVSLDPKEQVEENLFLPKQQLSYKELVHLLDKAIELLAPQQKRAYELSRNEGMGYEKIAEEMGISRLTVRTHVSKAISFVRQYLIDNGIHPAILIIFLVFIKS